MNTQDNTFYAAIEKYIADNPGIVQSYANAKDVSYEDNVLTKKDILDKIVMATKTTYSNVNQVTQADRNFVAQYLKAQGTKKTKAVPETPATGNTGNTGSVTQQIPANLSASGLDKMSDDVAQKRTRDDANKINDDQAKENKTKIGTIIDETQDTANKYKIPLSSILKMRDIDYLSGEDYETTLKKSRLMDYLNNRLWASPVGIGARHHTVNGASGTDLSNVVSGSRPHRKEPATTEDMRQMETMREIEAKRLNAMQEKQTAQYNMEHTLNMLSRDEQVKYMNLLMQLDANQQYNLLTKITDFEYLRKNQAMLEQWIEEESKKRNMRFDLLAAEIVNNMSKDDYVKANLVGQRFGVISPDIFTNLTGKIWSNIFSTTHEDGSALTTSEQVALFTQVLLDLAKTVGVNMFSIF